MRFHRLVAGFLLTGAILPVPCPGQDKPTGAPLLMSDIETEQPIPLAYLSPEGTAACSRIRLHWTPAPSTSADDLATLALDIAPDSPGAATFTAQFWNASLAGSLAWQSPWQGAHWKIFETPNTDGTGIDAGLAVGMIATSARRPYPKDTLVIGNLHPDSSLGAVSRLADRLDAAAQAGVARVIIPKVEQFETEANGQVIDILHHAQDLNLKCIPVDNIVEAVEVTMNDPLPAPPADAGAPKYSADVATYLDGFAQREQTEALSGLVYAPKPEQLNQYPAHQAAIWRQVFAEVDQGREAYKAGQLYVAYRLLERANSRIRGLNALTEAEVSTFDVKAALDTSEQLRDQLHGLMTPPVIDRAELQSALLIAEMADWAYDIEALLEGSELVTKQAFSQRSDATAAERDRAREAIVSANEEARYLLDGADFYVGLLPHLGDVNELPANTNAANLLPQLIPAQLATAQIFADGIRPQASELRVGLLFDPRLAAYVNVLRDEKAQWDARQRRHADAAPLAVPSTNSSAGVSVGPSGGTNSAPAVVATPTVSTNNAPVQFDPGNSYGPPHTEVDDGAAAQPRKLSDVAQCLIWVNTDCEIAVLDQKYLRLKGTLDPVTRDWHVQNRAQLDALLQLAATGAQQGAAFAQEAQVRPDVFGMILERASYLRLHGDDANALAGLRNYWRAALLGNMCWQLAHTHKAAAVDLGAEKTDSNKKDKEKEKEKKTAADKTPATNAPPVSAPPADATNVVVQPATDTNATPEPPSPGPTNVVGVTAATNAAPPSPTPPAPSVADTNEPPIAPVAKADDVILVNPVPAPADTNAAPVPPAPTDSGHYLRALPVDLSTNAPPTPETPAPTSAPVPNVTPVPPVAPTKDDEYTGGGDAATPPPVAKPVDPTATNAPSSIQ